MARRREAVLPPATEVRDGEPIVRANLNRVVEMSDSYVRLYANDMQVQTTPWDVRLVFGQIVGTPTTDKPTIAIRQVGELSMSPQFAKKVVSVLLAQLEQYEITVGEIPQPAE